MNRTALSLFTAMCLIGATRGWNGDNFTEIIDTNCTMWDNDDLFTKVVDIFTQSNCTRLTTTCCRLNGSLGCCTIEEYFTRDGSRFVLPLSLAAGSIVLIILFSYCLLAM